MRKPRQAAASFLVFLAAAIFFVPQGHGQTLKKVRMGSSSTNVSFLAIYTALHRGFYKDEGIDLEIVGARYGVCGSQ